MIPALRTRLASAAAALLLGAALIAVPGCKTDTDGVKSNYMQQYGDVIGSTEEVVNAAQDVLGEYNLSDITGKSDKLTGEARGIMADGTKVWVSAAHKTDTTTEVTVQVGKMGDNELGQKILADITEQLAEQNQ